MKQSPFKYFATHMTHPLLKLMRCLLFIGKHLLLLRILTADMVLPQSSLIVTGGAFRY